jgi:hypothetical protein
MADNRCPDIPQKIEGGYLEENNLIITHQAGFFSNCSVTLRAILGHHSRVHDQINNSKKSRLKTFFSNLVKLNNATKLNVFWNTQEKYRNPEQSEKNLFYEFFDPETRSIFLPNCKISYHFENCQGYKKIDFKSISPYIKTYFSPSKYVKTKMNQFIEEYSIIPDKTIALCYRGTDKFVELAPINIERYIEITKKLITENPDFKVLIQTDSLSARKKCIEEFKEKAFFIRELTATDSLKAIQNILPEERDLSNFDLGSNILASVNIMSRCKYVVTHTGNVGLWIFLYRGNPNNTIQLFPKNNPYPSKDKVLDYSNGLVEEECNIIYS